VALPIKTDEGLVEASPNIGIFDAAFELASMDTFVAGWARSSAIEDLAKTTPKTLTADEANKVYLDVEVPFSENINEAVAFHLNEEGKKRKFLQEKIAEGPGGNFYKGAVGLGAGLIAHALDPVEFGAGALGGMALTELGTIAAAGKFGKSAVSAGQFISKGGIGKEIVEGIATNAVLEPVMYNYSKEAQVDYSVSDAFTSVIGGGIAGPLAIGGARKGISYLSKISPTAFGLSIKTSIAQLENGKIPTPSAIVDNYKKLLHQTPEMTPKGTVRSEYEFKPLDNITAKESKFFASPVKPGDLESGTRVLGDYHGDGFYLTDNPNIANNSATHPMEEMTSDVFEMDIKDLNITDAAEPNKILLDSLDIDPTIKSVINSVDNIKDAQIYINDAIDNGILDETDYDTFMQAINKSGIDAIKDTDNVAGQNSLFVFKDSSSKLKQTARFDSDIKSSPKLSKKDLDEIKNTQKDFGVDTEYKKEFDNFESKTTDIPFDEKVKAVDNYMANMEELANNKLLDEDELAAFNELKEASKDSKEILAIAEDYANCLLSGAD
jgi:hypothetical protein